jgi:hypothetical protein
MPIKNQKSFISQLKAEMIKEVVEWDQNTDDHFKDLLTYCTAYIGWIKFSTFDIIYHQSREHIKQKTICIPIGFGNIDTDSVDAVSQIKQRILDFDWNKYITELIRKIVSFIFRQKAPFKKIIQWLLKKQLNFLWISLNIPM